MSPAKPQVTLIVPVYNVEKYLPKCIDSLSAQTFTDFEVLLIDDCSPDNSHKILNTICRKDKRFQSIKHEVNLGLPGARNTGLTHAKGEYVFFLDSDDYIASETIEVMVDAIETHRSDMVIGKVVHWYPDEDDLLDEGYLEPCQRENVYATALEHNPEFVIHVVAWHKLIRKAFLTKHRIRFNEDLRKHEDNPFSSQIFYHSDNFSFVKKAIYFYRQRHDPENPSIMDFGDLYYNARYKWLCLKNVLQNLTKSNARSRLRLREKIIISEATKTTEELIHWILPKLPRNDSLVIATEIEQFCNKFSKDILRYYFPDHYFFISIMLRYGPKKFIDFIETYYIRGVIEIQQEKALPPLRWMHNRYEIWKLVRQIRKSGIFDETWYLRNYADVRLQDIDPLIHFVRTGAWEGRSPSPDIDFQEFLKNNIQHLDASKSPLVRYLSMEHKCA